MNFLPVTVAIVIYGLSLTISFLLNVFSLTENATNMHQLQLNNHSLTIPDSWLKIKIETEYLEPQALEQPEINAIALAPSLGNLSANPSFAIPKFPNPRGLNTKQPVFRSMVETQY